jgi:hypothetical protein
MTKSTASNVALSAPSMDREELFQLVKRSDMNVAEIDGEGAVIELSVLWQNNILRVSHLAATQGFNIASEGRDSEDRMVLDESMLPTSARELSIVQRSNGTSFTIVPGARGEIEKDGKKLSIDEAIREGLASERGDGSVEVSLREGVRCKMILGGLTFSARTVAAARKVAGRSRRDPAIIASVLGAFALVGSFVGAGYLSSQQSNLLMADGSDDRLADIAAMVSRARERSLEAQPQPQQPSTEPSAQGAAASGPMGLSGRRDVSSTRGRLAVRDRGTPPTLARPVNAREFVQSRGIFAALGDASASRMTSSGLSHPFGAMEPSGHDDRDANGRLSGDSIGDTFGYYGLGDTGPGRGRGGNGEGTVCTGNCGFSTRGIGESPNGDRYGSTLGQRLASRGGRGPIVRQLAPEVGGEYDRNLVRRVVQRNLPQVTRCHEQGLSQNPSLAGRVEVTFIIGADGTVSNSTVRSSNLAVPSVATCIANAVRTWQFTAPQGGAITVHYPFMLQPAE